MNTFSVNTADIANTSDIAIYQAEGGGVEVRLAQDSIWVTQRQMAEVFDTTPENVLMHLRNIYNDAELAEEATTKDFLAVRQEGKRQVQRNIKHYNLDAVISVGYRVNSKKAVGFRQWATTVLRQHLTQGYSLNRQRLENNAKELEAALLLVRKIAQNPELPQDAGRGLLDVVTQANGLLGVPTSHLLDAFVFASDTPAISEEAFNASSLAISIPSRLYRLPGWNCL